jgi:SAM-dependent methyltransferase
LEQQLTNPTFEHRRRRLEERLANRTRRILEIGCGDGNFLAVLRRAGWDVNGQEVSAGTAAMVERRHRIPMIAGPLEAVPSDRPFPVVAAYHVFEHIYHPADWLRCVRDLIAPNGLLHLQVPNGASLTRRLSGDVWSALVFPQHVYFYDPVTLPALLSRFGFNVLTTTTWDPWHGPGTVTASVANMAARVLTGRRPWNDIAIERPQPGARPAAPPAVRHPLKVMLRSGLESVSAALARAEAAAGRGAIVDIVARRD